MQVNEIVSRLESVFREVFDDDTIVLTKEMTANDIDEWDSLTHIQLIVATEQEFNVKFMTAEIADLKNVGEFIALIGKKLENHE